MLKKTLNPPLFSRNHSPNSTPDLSPTSSSSESDFDDEMDAHRPVSLALPHGAFGSIRPSLEQVLNNTAPPPYTLSAFMAYLSQNHCLETLEFTLEAKRYRETFDSVARQLGGHPSSVAGLETPECQHLRMLWRRLLTAYILPNSPREINLTSTVRDNILRQANGDPTPHYCVLDLAVKLTHELMDESIFMPFLNTYSPSSSTACSAPDFSSHSGFDDMMVVANPGYEYQSERRLNSKSKRVTPPSSSAKELGSPFTPGSLGRSNFLTGLGKTNRSGQTSSQASSPVEYGLVYDSGSTDSAGDPITPPTTPPSSEPHSYLGHSPKNRTDNPWKKMGMKLGFNKKRSGTGHNASSANRDFKVFGMDD